MHVVVDGTHAINDIRAIKRYCGNLIRELAHRDTDLLFSFLFLAAKRRDPGIAALGALPFSEIRSHIPGRVLHIVWRLFNAPRVEHWVRKPFDLDELKQVLLAALAAGPSA